MVYLKKNNVTTFKKVFLAIIKSEELQKVLLPTYNRRLMLIHQNKSVDAHSNIKIKKHHHPISIIEEKAQGRINQVVVCKDSHDTFQLNTYSSEKDNWFRPINTDRLFLEKYVLYF